MLYFTKFADEIERRKLTIEDLSKFKYFMVIYLTGEYLQVTNKELTKLKIHLGAMDDYLVVVLKEKEEDDMSEALLALNQGFLQESQGAYIGTVLLSNIDSKSGTLKAIVDNFPESIPSDRSVDSYLWGRLKLMVELTVPLNDASTIKSKFTIELLLKFLKLVGLG